MPVLLRSFGALLPYYRQGHLLGYPLDFVQYRRPIPQPVFWFGRVPPLKDFLLMYKACIAIENEHPIKKPQHTPNINIFMTYLTGSHTN